MDNKIKITFFIPNLKVGGAEKSTVNLLNNLDKSSYTLSLILANKEGEFLKDIREDLVIINLGTYSLVKIFFKLIKYFKKEKPDIFISIFPRFSIASIMAKIFSRSDTKIIVIEHTVFSLAATNARNFFRRIIARFLFPLLMKFFYRNSEAIICVSKGVAEDILKITGLREKIKVIYNPIIDSKIYALAEEKASHPWILNKDCPVISAVGRLVKAKDYPALLYALSLVVNEKQAKLLILGDGEERKELELLANRLGIAEKVDFLGFQKNPYKFISKSNIFVLSSIQEGFPTVIIEAMACGVPVISTDCKAGPNEIIENRENGLLVPVGDEKSLAEAILQLLNSKALREKFSREGRNIAEYFTIEKSVKEYENIFKEILK